MNTSPIESAAVPAQEHDASHEFIGRWHDLISTTNWDKGRIISEWRAALMDAGSPPSAYGDEAWSNLVGNVTPQHVGRLRRVYDRFESDRVSYEGLYWSHFCAALEWDDAEMWLEGALQNGWSISQMRRKRWETLGSIPADEPQTSDIVVTEAAEENLVGPDDFREEADLPPELQLDSEPVVVEDDTPTSANTASSNRGTAAAANDSAHIYSGDQNPVGKFVQSFDELTDLPADLSEAFEQYKLVILRHKESGWDQVSQADMLASLEALKAMVVSA